MGDRHRKTVALVAAMALGVATAALALVVPASASAAVWTVPSTVKVYPTSRPGGARAISLSAALNEFEAAQVVVSGTSRRSVMVTWDEASDPLLVSSAELFKVGYVHVTSASTSLGTRPGWYPDPLPPASFGTRTRVAAGTVSFYVRFHVPPDAAAGLHRGTLLVSDPAPGPSQAQAPHVIAVPVTLRVWDFGWDRTSLTTAFPFSVDSIVASLRGALPETPALRATLADTYTRFLADHDLSPTHLRPDPAVDRATGHIMPNASDSRFSPYLGNRTVSPGMFPANALPLYDHAPWAHLSPRAVEGPLSTYLGELFSIYRANGWQDGAYAYVYDEPDYADELKTQSLAQIVHRVSAAYGFRAKVLTTDWPRRRAADGRRANAFLFDDVDIWCPSVYRLFGCQPELQRRREAGAATWWYTYARDRKGRYPDFLIDAPLADERCVPWLSWRWGLTGFLYWGTNRWNDPVTGRGFRDPYVDPVSYASRTGWVANGEASLVYPGYEPSRGLTDPYASPVSSLRLEALRDGIEDHEYLTLATAEIQRLDVPAGYAAAAAAAQIAATVCDYRYGACSSYLNLPSFATDDDTYRAARQHLAVIIERLAAGQGPITVTGMVTRAGTDQPVSGATVSDGLLSTTTGADGGFRLSGVVNAWRLRVDHPMSEPAHVAGKGDASGLAVGLRPDRRARLIAAFERRPGFRVGRGGAATLQSAHRTGGSHGVLLTLRPGAAATLSLPRRARDLRAKRTLQLDLYSTGRLDHTAPWFVLFSVADRTGHGLARRYLLKPASWTHLTLQLQGHGVDWRHLRSVGLRVTKGRHALFADTLLAR